jgi:hypothetical protein
MRNFASHSFIIEAVAAVALLAIPSSVQAQWLNYPVKGTPRGPDGKANLTAPSPRRPDGKPDMTGVWMGVEDLTGTLVKKE